MFGFDSRTSQLPVVVGIAADISPATALPYAHLDDTPAIAQMMRVSAVRIEDVLAHEAAGA